MGEFIDILQDFRAYDNDINHSKDLEKFFKVLKTFNRYKKLKKSVKDKIDQHFNYQW